MIHTQPARVAIALALTLSLLSACSAGTTRPYAMVYEEALDRYPGAADVDPAAIQRFLAFFQSTGDAHNDPGALADALYADALYFSDTLLTSEDKDQVVRYLRNMHESTRSLTVTLLDTQQQGADIYLVWRMTAEFQPALRPVTSHSIGITHLRFDADGQIVLQQDFWDASAGFYEHVPILGSAIRSIKGRFYD